MKEGNNETIRYICCQKSKNECPDIRTNEPNLTSRYTVNHNHLLLSDIEAKLFIREQELKAKLNCKRSTQSQRADSVLQIKQDNSLAMCLKVTSQR